MSKQASDFLIAKPGSWSTQRIMGGNGGGAICIQTMTGWNRAESCVAEKICLYKGNSEICSFPNDDAGRSSMQSVIWTLEAVYEAGRYDMREDVLKLLGAAPRG